MIKFNAEGFDSSKSKIIKNILDTLSFPHDSRDYEIKFRQDKFYIKCKKERFETIFSIDELMHENDKIYIHCKGGHGRSGVVVAILLCNLFNLTPEEALEHTTKSHNNRIIMRDKWRQIGSPQTYHQKHFVRTFCKPINFFKATHLGYTAGFSNFSNHSVHIPNRGLFPTSEAAFQSYKLNNNEYINKQLNALSPNISRLIGNKIILTEEWWSNIAPDILFKILKYKFIQHPELKENLLNTGISPIIYNTKTDNMLGIGYDSGKNLLGKTLVKLRTYFLLE